jgi:thymidylate synthase
VKIIKARNVNDAYKQGWYLLEQHGDRQPSRAGDVLVFEEPVTTQYLYPTERVLFDRRRGANPFFHFFESIWMLAGSNDARWLDKYVSDFSSRFAEESGLMHGAYGHRWREAFSVDQLPVIVGMFQNDQYTRQAVLGMWDPEWDLELTPTVKDKPCNTHIYFRIVDGELDMTVCNRSNDMIWGAYGANAVHMSFLHEWLATTLSIPVGVYYQISNNFHAYVDTMKKIGGEAKYDPYSMKLCEPYPIPGGVTFLKDCEAFVDFRSGVDDGKMFTHSVWWNDVAVPLEKAHTCFKAKDYTTALAYVSACKASDWRLAADNYIRERAGS